MNPPDWLVSLIAAVLSPVILILAVVFAWPELRAMWRRKKSRKLRPYEVME